MNQDFSPPYPMEQINCSEYDQHQQRFSFVRNHQIVASSSSSSSSSSLCNIISNPTQDHAGFYHPQLFQPHHHHPEDEYYGYGGGSSYSYERENRVENGLKLSLWKKEDEDSDGVKWKSVSKKKGDPTASIPAEKVEVKKVKLKLKRSSSLETNLTSHSLSYNCNTTIRVCSDCHTTKTPLWRSGPKGPKSLCNACGIRQRKARRAMSARAGNGGGVTSDPPPAVKKRCKLGAGSSTNSGKKMDFEDFLINLSNKLAFNRVFPQDEKEAAILLMALSSGLVHG